MRRIACNWHLILLSWLLFFLIVPFDVTYPGMSLDPSWRMGVNVAVSQHLAFGRDIVFTYGPYAAVSTRVYHPDLVWLTLGGGLILAVAYVVAALGLLRSAPRWLAVALSIALALGLASVDSLSLIYPLVAVVAVHRLTPDAERGNLGWGDRIGLAVLALPFALLPLVKLSSVPAVLVCVVAVSMLLALRGHRLEAATLWVVPGLGIVLLWLAAGQPLGALSDYFVTSVPIVSGYTQAMSVEGDATQAKLVVFVTSLAVLVMLVGSALVLTERLVVAAAMTATSFLTFKAAFVRQDYYHVLTVIVPLLIVAAVAASYCRSLPSKVLVVVSCLAVALPLRFDYALPGQEGTPATIAHAFTAGPVALAQRVVDPGLFDERYDEALADIRDADLVPKVAPGSDVDMYAFVQSSLLAQPGVHWNPRPIFQSYSAYTPALTQLNRDHLAGPSAPEEVLFTISAIDDRLPALEDGTSWLPLLEKYQITGYDERRNFLELHRRAKSVAIPVTKTSVKLSGTLGDRLPLPGSSPGWLARFDIRPTLKGRLRELLWKTSTMTITVTLKNGHEQRFRFVPEMGRSQFLLSPLVLNPQEVAGLVSTSASVTDAIVPPRVRSIRLDSGKPDSSWKRDYTVELNAVELPSAAAGTGADRPGRPASPTR